MTEAGNLGTAMDSTYVDTARDYAAQGVAFAQDWLLRPASWSQFALLIAAYLLALVLARMIAPRLRALLTPEDANTSIFATARRFARMFLPLLLPLLAYVLTAAASRSPGRCSGPARSSPLVSACFCSLRRAPLRGVS